MKYHKIRGVELSVCSAEQKIAFNMAFRASVSFKETYDKAKAVSAICKEDLLNQIIKIELDAWRENGNSRYDIDAIFAALRSGLERYMDKPFIPTSYKEVGEAFPANY